MAILKRPMFRKGGSVNEGIMHGLEDRSGYAGGGRTIGGGTIQGTPMGYRTGFSEFAPIGSTLAKNLARGAQLTGYEGLISQGMMDELMDNPVKLKKAAEKNPWLMRLFPWLRVGGGAAVGSGLGSLTDFYLRSTDTPQAYAKRKEVVRDDPWAYHETDLEIDDEGNFYTRGSVYDKEIDELQKVGKPPGFFPRGGKKKWYEEQGIDPGTGLTIKQETVPPEAITGYKIPIPEVKSIEDLKREKDDGGIDGLSANDAKTIIADKKSMLSDRAKEFAELLSPGAQKRAIYDSLAAASESFGKSTGNTRQDIANAISAAAKGMGGATDTYQKARLLAIEEDIKKGIAEAGTKDRTLGNYEFLVQLKKTDEPTYYELVKNKDTDINRVITLSDKYVADPNAIGKGMGDNFKLKSIEAGDAANNYGGSLPDKIVKKEVVEDFDKMEKGLIYFNPLDLKFYSLDEKGEPIQVPKPKYLK